MLRIFVILQDDRIFTKMPACECSFREDGIQWCGNNFNFFAYEEIAVIGQHVFDDELGETTRRIWEREDYGG